MAPAEPLADPSRRLRRRFGEPRPRQGEAPVRDSEVFFSRTDARGVILSGNEVFRRVTDHPWEDLIGAPHAITRHPDMPRGITWLLWQRLAQGTPVGVYLKNRARDGLWYWVFAIIAPVEGGYLSVQFKPTSAALTMVRREYADLLALEGEQALSPDAAGEAFLARLADLGYPSYDGFMAHALAGEVDARAAKLQSRTNPALPHFARLTEEVSRVEDIAREVADRIAAIRNVPANLQILATRLEATGGPISVLSANYATISAQISAWSTRFVSDGASAFGRMRAALDSGRFLQGAADIQDEALAQFRRERRRGPAGSEEMTRTDIALLEDQAALFRAQAQAGLDRVAIKAEGFARAVVEMKRLVTGLSSTRMLCKIESARREQGSDSLNEIIRQLDGFQVRVEEQLVRFSEVNRIVQSGAETLRTCRHGPNPAQL